MSWTASKLSPVRRKERIEFLEEKMKKEFLLNGTNALSELESLYRKLSVSRQAFKIILRLHSPWVFVFFCHRAFQHLSAYVRLLTALNFIHLSYNVSTYFAKNVLRPDEGIRREPGSAPARARHRGKNRARRGAADLN